MEAKCSTIRSVTPRKKGLEISQLQGLFPSSCPPSLSLSTHSCTSKETYSFGSEMGFPVGYAELPKLFLQLLSLLGHLRRLISWAFNSLGLGVLDSDAQWPETTHHHHHHHQFSDGGLDPKDPAGVTVRGLASKSRRRLPIAGELHGVPLRVRGGCGGAAAEQLPARLPPVLPRPLGGARPVHLPPLPGPACP